MRGDDYRAGDQIVNPQYGLTWRATKDWLFRTTYSTSFRPPSLFELYMPTLQPSLLIADPLRGGEVSNVNIIVGGNPDLEVVTARSFTAGFVFSPSELPGLSVTDRKQLSVGLHTSLGRSWCSPCSMAA